MEQAQSAAQDNIQVDLSYVSNRRNVGIPNVRCAVRSREDKQHFVHDIKLIQHLKEEKLHQELRKWSA